MFKKYFRCSKIRKPKRTTFLKMISKGMILPILLTILVGEVVVHTGSNFIKNNINDINKDKLDRIISSIEKHEVATNNKIPIEFGISLSSYESITTEGLINRPFILATTYDDPESASVLWCCNNKGDIVFSNRAKMSVLLTEEPDAEKKRYCYFDPIDLNIPELNELFSQFFSDVETGKVEYELSLKSLYLNRDNNKMIPHEMSVKRYATPIISYINYTDNPMIDERNLVIDAQHEGYELVVIGDMDEPNDYPRAGLFGIWGEDPEKFDKLFEEYGNMSKGLSGMQMVSPDNNNLFDFHGNRVISRENEYGITNVTSVARINTMNRHAVRKYVFITAVVFIISSLFVLVMCIIRNAKNKALYAFEDYQQSLINNLAHDLKTPLAVIGGYAENLQELRYKDGSEKEHKYINSILNNVAYTDDIIIKTLQLSESEHKKKLNKTRVDLKDFIEKLTEKYLTALEERNITLKSELRGEIFTDEDLLSSVLENLISNAVKYTRNDGTISIVADKKRLCIVNDVSEDIDTKDLTMPFVKGDKARSDKRSHGLGLAIATSAAARNGFNLKVSCKSKRFIAELVF